MNRIFPILIIVALLVAGGFWLSYQTSSNAQTTEETSAATSETRDAETLAEAFEPPEGFTLTPFLSDTQTQSFDQAEEVLEPGTDYFAVIETNKGRMIADLFEDEVTGTVNNFVFLARHHYYDGIVFHRVLDGFMAQTGDPTGTGRGGPGYTFEDEIVEDLSHDGPGILSMANSGPNTNGSQFFIIFEATPWLDGRHTVFGELTEGSEVLADLQRIDPQTPSAVLRLDQPLGELEQRGVSLNGEADMSLETYLEDALGAVPAAEQTFTVDGYQGVVGRVGGEPAVGFFPQPDFIERVYIIEKES